MDWPSVRSGATFRCLRIEKPVWGIMVLAMTLSVAGADARELPARIVVLDEQSPHLALVAAVRDAFADQLDALTASPDLTEPATSANGGDKESSAEGILKRLTLEVIDGSLQLPLTANSIPSDQPYNTDPLVTTVAAELDLESGNFVLAYEGTTLGFGQIAPVTETLPTLPGPLNDGTCSMPALVIFPSVTDSTGLPRRRPKAAWGIDTALCRYFVPTARDIRKAKLYKGKLEDRSVRRGEGVVFTGTEDAPSEPEQQAASSSGSTFTGCGSHVIKCGAQTTNHFARVKSRIQDAFGNVATNALAQTYWKWDGQRSVCANVGGTMYDRILIDGPDQADYRWEPRDCGRGSGDHSLNENCLDGSRCPLQWLASTLAPNSSFQFWAATIGFHRFHYWLPGGTPVPAGAWHGFYHWARVEYLVEPTRAFFKQIACGAGGDYGRGFPWYQYNTCFSEAG